MFRALFVVLLFVLTHSIQVQAQQHVLDSLENLLKLSRATDENRVDLLNQLSYEYYDFNDSIGFHYANLGLEAALKLKYQKGIKYGYLLTGIGHLSRCEYKLALKSFNKSHNTKTPGDLDKVIYNLTLIGNVYRSQGNYDSALYYYGQAHTFFASTPERDHAVVYKNMAMLYLRLWSNKLALAYLDSASSILEKSNKSVLIDVWANYGLVYQNLQQLDKSNMYFEKVCSESEKFGDYFHRIKCLLNKVQLEYLKADFTLALSHGFKALELTKVFSYPPQQVELLTRMGEVYTELSEYAIAGKYFLQALRIAERYGLKYEIAYLYGELGWVYKDQGNLTVALDYLDQSQRIREEIGDRFGVAICHNNRGLIFLLQKKYDQSLAEHNEAKKIRIQLGHAQGIASSIFNASLVYIETNQIDKALLYQLDAISIEEKLDNKQSLAISYNFIASLYLQKRNLTEAERFLKKCEALAVQTQSKLLERNNAGYFSDLYEAKGDFKKALAYRKLYQQLNDSIYSKTNSGKLAEMQALYQLDKKDQEITLLNQEREIQKIQLQVQRASLRQQRLVIATAIIGLILISGFSFFVWRYYRKVDRLNKEITEQNEEIQAQSEELSESNQSLIRLNNEIVEKNEEIQAQSEELIEANQTISEVNRTLEKRVDDRTTELRQAYKELDTFFYRASHDFRRPLTTFMGLAEVAKITVKDNNALELFSKVNDTAHYLDKMLIKLQSISDLGGQELVYKEVFFKEIFDNVSDSYRDTLKERNIKTTFKGDLVDPFYSYPALFKIIVENLFENAIFFCSTHEPYIRMGVSNEQGVIVLEVEDNGEGIAVEYHERVFDMYFRANERSKGNGLGLYIVSKAVEKLQGAISFVSETGKGTVFTLTFPDKIF